MTVDQRIELLRGTRVSLRRMDEADAADVVEWRNREDTRKWLIQWKPLTRAEHLEWFKRASQRGDLLFMFDGLDGRPIGTCSVYDFDHPGTSAEWGRICAAKIGGNPGGILEGCYLTHRLCFEVLHLVRLHLSVAADNERALRLYEFLGYAREGLRRRHWAFPGGRCDVVPMGLFPDEFEQSRPAVEGKLYPDAAVPEISDEKAARIRKALGR